MFAISERRESSNERKRIEITSSQNYCKGVLMPTTQPEDKRARDVLEPVSRVLR